jgi:hypothetical protein
MRSRRRCSRSTLNLTSHPVAITRLGARVGSSPRSTSELAHRERPRHPRSVWTLAVAK